MKSLGLAQPINTHCKHLKKLDAIALPLQGFSLLSGVMYVHMLHHEKVRNQV